MLVIDEEQRFGVNHKESLRHLKAEVDTISMSATPIPRTLNMSLMGVRDISVINTPPLNRKLIRTRILKFNEFALREAIQKGNEKKRTGVFHPQRSGNHQRNGNLPAKPFSDGENPHRTRPNEKNDLEKVMLDFVEKRFELLLCTTIVESGLDIPNANTIIVNNAHRFGLSQLYQLRGRVGRGNKQAYAYLLTPKEEVLKDVAKKRLGALQEIQEIASGFKIAAFDMELRGIGNLLGTKQSGHVEHVGLELYLSMVDEEVKRLKGEAVDPKEEKFQVKLNLPAESLFPENYLPSSALRLQAYKELTARQNETELWEFKSELEDRYGLLPSSAENLFKTMRVKMAAKEIRAVEISADQSGYRVKIEPVRPVNLEALMGVLKENRGRLQGENTLAFDHEGFSFEKLIDLLSLLGKTIFKPEDAQPTTARQ